MSNKLDGKRPQSDFEYALWKAVELRAGRNVDMKTVGKSKPTVRAWFVCTITSMVEKYVVFKEE